MKYTVYQKERGLDIVCVKDSFQMLVLVLVKISVKVVVLAVVDVVFVEDRRRVNYMVVIMEAVALFLLLFVSLNYF